MTDNKERENFYHNSYIHKGFISVSLENHLMKIFVSLRIIIRVTFKDLGFDFFLQK